MGSVLPRSTIVSSACGLAELTNVGSRSYPLPSLAPSAAYSLGGLGRKRSTKLLEEASAERGWGSAPTWSSLLGLARPPEQFPNSPAQGAQRHRTSVLPPDRSARPAWALARDERGIGDDHPHKPRAYQMAPALRDAAREVAAGKTLPIHGWTP
jgi:hypothetical protein